MRVKQKHCGFLTYFHMCSLTMFILTKHQIILLTLKCIKIIYVEATLHLAGNGSDIFFTEDFGGIPICMGLHPLGLKASAVARLKVLNMAGKFKHNNVYVKLL